jgi:hypothetical protein
MRSPPTHVGILLRGGSCSSANLKAKSKTSSVRRAMSEYLVILHKMASHLRRTAHAAFGAYLSLYAARKKVVGARYRPKGWLSIRCVEGSNTNSECSEELYNRKDFNLRHNP